MSNGNPVEASSTLEFEQHREDQHAVHTTAGHNTQVGTTHGALTAEHDGYVWLVESGGLALAAIMVVVISKITKKHPKGKPK